MPHATRGKSRRDGTISLTTGDPTTHEVAVEEGNLSISGLNAGNRDVVVVEDRGDFSSLIEGGRTYPTFTFTATLRDLVDSGYTTLVGVATQTGSSAGAESTLGTGTAVPYCVNLLWTVNGSTHGEGADHTVSLSDCRITSVDLAEGEINTITISGTCYGAIAFT